MKVTLIDGTGMGSEDPARYAANIIVYTRSTRLKMSPGLLDEVRSRSTNNIMDELKQAANTLPSSWEFIDFTFLIEGVTRAFTHQLVRTRTASYAQQAMRIVDVSDFEYSTGPTIANDPLIKGAYHNTMDNCRQCYTFLIEAGAKAEDARGVLPTNVHTNINMKINMRNWVNLIRKRTSARVQDEYHKVIDLMIIEVEKVYPWIYLFVKTDELTARKALQNMIWENKALSTEEKTAMVKKLDLIIKDV